MSALNRVSMSGALVASLLCPLSAGATTYQTIYTLDSASGYEPNGAMVVDQRGNLYGTTFRGGPQRYGTVFRLDPTTAQLTVLHAFSNGIDGGQPDSSVVFGPDGMLFGTTTTSGGAGKYGTVFMMSPVSGALTTLHAFEGGAGGESPNIDSPIVVDSAGTLYGTTVGGGTKGLGSIYAIDIQTKAFKTVYSFQNGLSGEYPAGLKLAPSGLIYGWTEIGAAAPPPKQCGSRGCSTIFVFNPTTNAFKILADLTSLQGIYLAGLTVANADTIYGIGSDGGTADTGTLFSVSLKTGLVTVLHNFVGTTGSNPFNGLVMDDSDVLYGVASAGSDATKYGAVFQFDTNSKQYSVLHGYGTYAGGRNPVGLTLGTDGVLYGGTGADGSGPDGTVFKIIP